MPIALSGPDAAFEMEVGADGEIEFGHVAGEPVDVDEFSTTISVNGEPLERPLEISFKGNEGFNGAAPVRSILAPVLTGRPGRVRRSKSPGRTIPKFRLAIR